MKALCWHGKQDVRIDEVPDPEIVLPTDAIIRVTASAICGSDLHIYNHLISEMASGDILGHEFMGEVVAIGKSVKKLKIGEKVVVPFTIACGFCHFCKHKSFSLCEYSNPNAELARAKMGQSPSGVFGYSHLLGGFAGGQSEFVRVPYADVGCIKIPSGISDEKVLFLSDIFPTGYMAAENCDIQRGDTVAVWGCGPVGQFAIQSAWMLGAERVIAIDCEPERLKLAEKLGKAEVINFKEENVLDALMVMTKGRGPECCIDAVGCEAHGHSMMEQAKQAIHLMSDKAHVLREAIQCCAKGGHISVPGVYLSTVDALPFSAAMNKGLTFKMGQTHVQRYLAPLLKKIMNAEIDPSKIITHRITLDKVPEAYKMFNDKADGCVKVIIKN